MILLFTVRLSTCKDRARREEDTAVKLPVAYATRNRTREKVEKTALSISSLPAERCPFVDVYKRQEQPSEQSLWGMLEGITENLKHKRLADVFRFVSFRPFETFGPHKHLRIEINYVKKRCV